MSILNNSLLLGADAGGGGYAISRSVRFNSSDSAYCGRNFTSAGNQKKWTWAGWVKRSTLSSGYQTLFSAGSGGGRLLFGFGSGDTFSFELQGVGSHATTAVFRDPSAWYHVVVAFDTTQATAADRTKVWINNTLQALSGLTFSQNTDYAINSSVDHRIGCQTSSVADFFNGYLADVHFIDGQALDPSSFTEVSATTGQLIPKAYTGTFTGNSFWLKFADNSAATATTLGKDSSGLGNNWTPNNLSVTAGAGNDSLVDTPTSYGTDTGAGGEVRGNYCTWNPLNTNSTLSNGNLDATTSASSYSATLGTIGLSSGKWYWENVYVSGSQIRGFGVATGNTVRDEYLGQATSWGYMYTGVKVSPGNIQSSYGNSWTTGDVIGVAFDADAGNLYFYKNGVAQNSGTAAFTSLTSGPYFPIVTNQNTSTASGVATVNFGQRPFAYTAPSGFKALCDTNLPAPVVAKPNEVMDVKLYTGNGSTQTISGLNFSPDFIWTKSRSRVDNNVLHDIVRGRTSNLYSDLAASENTTTLSTADLVSFDANGYTLGTVQQSAMNRSGETYVAWCFDAGTTTTTNTVGSISSQVRANPSAGFSIVTATKSSGSSTAQTFGHGLGVEPHMIILKRRNGSESWYVYNKVLGNAARLQLNETSAVTNGSGVWGSTTPTSQVFTVQSFNDGDFVAYCFAPVAGYSSFGSFSANNSSDGNFIYLGFRPRWIMTKQTSGGGGNWFILDTARNTYNVMNNILDANLSDAERNANIWDATANGMKLRIALSGDFIYAAFAEHPFQYARAR
jgi:hypothetical protein